MKEGGRTMKRNHKAKDKEEEREELKENNNNEVVDSRSQGGEGGSQLQSVLTTACTSYHYDMPYALILDYLKAVAVAPELFNLHLDFYRIMHSLLQISYDYMRIDMGKDKHLHDVYIDICNYPADPTPFDSLVDNIGKLVKVEGTIVKMSQPFLMPIGYKLVCRFCKHNKIVYMHRLYTNLTGDNNNNMLDDDKMLRCMICDVDLDIEPLYLGYYKLTLQEDIGTQKSVRMVDCIVEARRLLDYNSDSDSDGGYNDSRKIIRRKADLGDKVSVLGVVTPILATSSKKGGNGNNHHGMAATSRRAADICIDTYHLEQIKKSNVTLSDYDIGVIQSLLRREHDSSIYELLVSSFAPHIYGHKVIKEAILLQLALTGISNSKHYTKRMNLHILLVGDPGTAKSQLLLYTAQIAPIAIYTTGKGSSAAGLSVAVVKDDSSSKGLLTASTGGYTIMAGATVLASGGIACIDEFLTMRSEDRAVLHEIMEQQTVSIAKAGINASFKAETSILAACNPIRGYYDPYRSLLENIEILPSLLSRFDLVFVVRDEKDTDTDTNISNAIISSMYRRGEEENTELGKVDGIKLSKEMLTKWLIYCKRFYPIMSESAAKRLQEYYLKLREKSSVTEGMLITPRQLETLIRLATARARLLCREDVIADDIDAAIRVYEHMLSTFIDTTTKHPDIGVMTGTSVGERAKRSIFLTVLKNLQTKYQDGVNEETIISELVKTNQFTEETAQIYLSMAKREGLIYEVERDKFKLV